MSGGIVRLVQLGGPDGVIPIMLQKPLKHIKKPLSGVALVWGMYRKAGKR